MPAFAVIRIGNKGKMKCLITNSWMHNQVYDEVGTYEMLLPAEDMDVLRAGVKNIAFTHQEVTYGRLYADSGVQVLEINYDGKTTAAKWGANSENELPGDIQLLRKKLLELSVAIKAYPVQVLGCTAATGTAEPVFEIKNRGSSTVEIRNEVENGTHKAFLRYLVLPAGSNWFNSSSFIQAYREGIEQNFPDRFFAGTANNSSFLQAGEAINFVAEQPLPEQQAHQCIVVAVARFAAVVNWDEAPMLTDFTCVILPPGNADKQ